MDLKWGKKETDRELRRQIHPILGYHLPTKMQKKDNGWREALERRTNARLQLKTPLP